MIRLRAAARERRLAGVSELALEFVLGDSFLVALLSMSDLDSSFFSFSDDDMLYNRVWKAANIFWLARERERKKERKIKGSVREIEEQEIKRGDGVKQKKLNKSINTNAP